MTPQEHLGDESVFEEEQAKGKERAEEALEVKGWPRLVFCGV